MLAALFLFRRSGEARWRDLYRQGADALWAAWTHDPAAGCWLWTQDLYGHVDKQLGALHGFAGVAHALLEGCDLFDPDRATELVRRVRETLAATALREDQCANWPMTAGPTDRPGAATLRVQHCMGAPGMVNALAGLPRDPETDALLLAAGELTWKAGPPAKAPGLCHGAPGSGYALLKLHARTGDAIWLARARAFAMHAVEQAERAAAVHGQRKFSLWTGDLGLACFLWDSIHGGSAFPTLDGF